MASRSQLLFTVILILLYYETEAESAQNFSVRFGNNLYNNTGRVEVFHDGQWGGICGNSWNYNDAIVVCRMLGYNNGTSTTKHYYQLDSAWYEWFGNDTDPGLLWMDNVRCSGTESSLADCPFDGWGVPNCNAYDGLAYAFCYNEDDSEVKVRLVDGTSEGTGHVEVHYSSIWGGVCWDGFDYRAAEVVCRMLGYSNGVSFGASVHDFTKIPSWMDWLQCNGTETNIADCPFGGWGQISSSLGVATALCYNDFQATDEQQGVRLVDESIEETNITGAVEIMYGGQWSTLCGEDWDDVEAKLACRMFGYRDGEARWYGSYLWESKENLKLKIHVNCLGSEASFYNCTYFEVPAYCNYQDGRAGVSCWGNREFSAAGKPHQKCHITYNISFISPPNL